MERKLYTIFPACSSSSFGWRVVEFEEWRQMWRGLKCGKSLVGGNGEY